MKTLIKIIIAGILATILLSVFSLFYNYPGGGYISKAGMGTDFSWASNQVITNCIEGYSIVKMDKNGYNNPSVTSKDMDVLIMGSSHMEAYQVSQEENTAALLSKMLPYLTIYNIGMNSHTIYDCMRNIGFAADTYNPETMVIETFTVKMDKSTMRDSIEYYDYPMEGTVSSGPLVKIADLIPAFRPIFYQLKYWIQRELASYSQAEITSAISEENIVTPDYLSTLEDFLSLTDNLKEKGVKDIIILYHPAQSYDSNGTVLYDTNPIFLKAFSDTCSKLGITFINTQNAFESLYRNKHQFAYGFINTAIASGHLNKYGHRVVAEVLADTLQNMEGK